MCVKVFKLLCKFSHRRQNLGKPKHIKKVFSPHKSKSNLTTTSQSQETDVTMVISDRQSVPFAG